VARKAVLAAVLLGAGALLALAGLHAAGTPSRVLGGLGSVVGLAGLLVLSRDAIAQDARQRRLLLLTFVAALGTWFAGQPGPDVGGAAPGTVLLLGVGLLCGLAFVGLPLWLLAARVERALLVACAAVAAVAATASVLLAGAPGVQGRLVLSFRVAAWAAYGGSAGVAWLVAYRLWSGTGIGRTRKPPRLVVASNIVQWTPEQKARRLAELEARFAAGELAEHDYWDRRQEIESR
jgi:hypothetical protein